MSMQLLCPSRAVRKVAIMRPNDTDAGRVVDEREINPQDNYGEKPLQAVMLDSDFHVGVFSSENWRFPVQCKTAQHSVK